MRRSTEGLPRHPAVLSRRAAWFLLAFGVWSWFIWITFVKNLWQDGSGLAFDDAGDPTAYFWVHLLLAITSFVLGTVIGLIGLRAVRAYRGRAGSGDPAGSGTAT
ncbi:SCO4848 family membrane protein [Streptomyces sp. URMC 123]|uniref:SCO4848 family membrane protein n=1 Tax=Streptomyces sp. URMC 123 TaxID=3423403 RepID=UPI003F19604F